MKPLRPPGKWCFVHIVWHTPQAMIRLLRQIQADVELQDEQTAAGITSLPLFGR
ncbi:hypothetical protein ARMA_2121 [Ardenticatena maritima]|uniref:Uncharacterized protein n=1 Tax=Ardenticatena maritima TaxID=872965 RepID=A0A0M9UD72_9CHLR|nr:hypothetical protein ARMA_2121 [Ardenticatena maritima]